MKLFVTVPPGGDVPRLLRALAGADGPMIVSIPRPTDDIQPRDHLPRALFLPHQRGEVAAMVERTGDADTFAWITQVIQGAGFPSPAGWLVQEHVVLAGDGARGHDALKMVAIGGRRPDLTVDEFERHWREVHGPLALTHHIGLSRYVQNLVLERLGPAHPAVDSFAELHFRTVDDFVHRLYDSPEGRRIIADDARNFGGGGDTHFFTETLIGPG